MDTIWQSVIKKRWHGENLGSFLEEMKQDRWNKKIGELVGSEKLLYRLQIVTNGITSVCVSKSSSAVHITKIVQGKDEVEYMAYVCIYFKGASR